MPWTHIKGRDAWIAFAVIALGATLYFIAVSSLNVTRNYMLLALGIGFALGLAGSNAIQHWKSWLLSRNQRVVRESLLIEPKSHGEITFAPAERLRNPTLFLRSDTPSLSVIELWFEGIGTLMTIRNTAYWNRGVSYSGQLSWQRNMRILFRNETDQPATVRAKIVATKDKDR